MIRICSMQDLPRLRKSAVCIGIFDGVHRGHQKIIQRTVSAARSMRIPAVGVTFDPHPLRILAPHKRPALLYSLKHRLIHMRDLGLTHCLVLRFTKALSNVSAERFVRRVLVDRLETVFLCVGSDFRFGYAAKGNIRKLRQWSRKHRYRLEIVPPIRWQGRIVSSTKIREFILKGDFKRASSYLGRPVSLFGTVVKGRGRGARLGYPTINIELQHETFPASGVYAIEALCQGKKYFGALHLGPRPTFDEAEPSAEAHLFNVRKSFYGKEIEISLLKKIRNIKRFKSDSHLKNQIGRDIRAILRFLKREGG